MTRSITTKPLLIALLGLSSLALVAGCAGEEGERGDLGPEGPQGAPGTIDPNLSTLEKALLGTGGRVAITSMSGFSLEATGGRTLIGEGFAAGDGGVEAATFTAAVHADLANNNLRVDYVRQLGFGPVSQLTYSEIIEGDLGFISGSDSILEAPGNSEEMLSARLGSTRRQQRLLNPHLILRDIENDVDGVVTATEVGVALHNGVIHELLEVSDPVQPLTLFVNASNGQIAKLTTRETDFLRRDVTIEYHYVGWQLVDDDVLFPRDVFIVKQGEVLHRERRSEVIVDPAFDGALFDLPSLSNPIFIPDDKAFGERSHQFFQMFSGIGINIDQVLDEESEVIDNEVSPGVFYLTGGSHHSLVVAYDDGVVIIEAPLYPERSEAIIDWLDNLVDSDVPDKTITHVIATHHHEDHTGGLRTFAALGAEIVLQENSEAFFEKIFQAPSEITPDRLSMADPPVVPDFDTVPTDGTFELRDDANALVLKAYHMRTTHSNDMLIVHLPAAGLVWNSDLWTPFPSFTFDPKGVALDPTNIIELHDAIQSLIITGDGGTVTGLVAGHGEVFPSGAQRGQGRVGPFQDLIDAVTTDP